MTRNKTPPPSSSPAPIRESQPRPDSPTETAHGTKPYHALYDTPPEGTQLPELKRSDRARTMSTRARETLEYQHQRTPTVSKSNATATQPGATSATQTTSSQRRKGPAKRRTLRFDGESSGDESGDKSGNKSRILKPRKPRNTTGSQAYSPPPKPPGRGRAPAQGDPAPEQPVILEADTVRQFGDLIGINVSTATSTTIKEALQTLSDPNPLQVGPARRYSQVRGQSPVPLPSLNKKGGYYRETLLKLAHPRPSESQKRTRSDEEDRPAKHTHGETCGENCGEGRGEDHGEDRGESADEEMWDPDADKPEPSVPAPPRLPSFFLPPQPLSTSSTQRAMVNAFASQHSVAKTPDFRPTPVPQPKNPLSWFTSMPRTSNPESGAPNPKPRRTGPELTRPDPGSRSATPGPHRAKATHPLRPAVPLVSAHKPAPDPNSATEEETESEPELKPKPKHVKKTGRGQRESPNPGTKSADRRQHSVGERNRRDAPSIQHHGVHAVLWHLNDLLGDNPNPDTDKVESLLQQAVDLTQQRRAGRDLSSRTQPSPSSSRAQPRPPSSSHTQPGPSSLHAQPTSSSSHARPGLSSGHRSYQQPTREGCPSGHNSEEEASAGETDVEGTDADDPLVPEKSGLGRYPGTRGKVASRAIPKLLSTATRKGIYQDHDTCIKWARNAYRRVWKTFCPHLRYRECPFDLLQTMVSRISNLRTEVKKRIRQLIRYLFGFLLGLSEEVLLANRQLVARLGHNNFHCRNLVPDRDQYEHEAFIRAIYDAYFWYSDSFLIRDTEHLDEMVKNGLPLPAVAFVLTMMQDCIEEWQTGQFKPRELNLTTQRSIFDAHLMGLLQYRRRAPRRLSEFQQRWFEDGMVNAGVEIHQREEGEKFCQSITRAENVWPDTPEESEDSEPEYDGDGRLTARSKGKFRVRE
ncbi:hypothetical protein FRC06_005864 [Ceratobasidium sp. 370]|nr:hypothetical protein FRC06_005864 [Ceratobasidium sp. 370]